MIGSLPVKIIIGVVIFLTAMAYQNEKLKKLVPDLDQFSQKINISGIYSYEQFGRNIITRVGDTLFYCGVDYNGGNASCFSPLKGLPKNSQITVAAASIGTTSGKVLCATSIKFNSQELYIKSPENYLHNWWISSYLEASRIPLILMAIYALILIILS
ncbi:hypothetical protein ISP15_00015 [Dyella jejuensis]|uniref:Uncharacterized protein n=1 Tax=Dyella jejuensis TaxID=1432009 RepID=A0ABW8JEI9_9GAMM